MERAGFVCPRHLLRHLKSSLMLETRSRSLALTHGVGIAKQNPYEYCHITLEERHVQERIRGKIQCFGKWEFADQAKARYVARGVTSFRHLLQRAGPRRITPPHRKGDTILRAGWNHKKSKSLSMVDMIGIDFTEVFISTTRLGQLWSPDRNARMDTHC